MKPDSGVQSLQGCLDLLSRHELAPLDFLPEGSLAEKMISLVLNGQPMGISVKLAGLFQETLSRLREPVSEPLRVVTLGGGTGLSNIIGGDSRRPDWPDNPFTGMKEVFPGITSIVCVTDDGGSTGELLKDLPLIGLGDLRHVLLSSIRRENLQARYGVDAAGARRIAVRLHAVFNHRFSAHPASAEELATTLNIDGSSLPQELTALLRELISRLFTARPLQRSLAHPQCLGNLLLASAIFARIDATLSCAELAAEQKILHRATIDGLADIAEPMGAEKRAVLPCTTTPALLQLLYSNGILVTGEHKSSLARRGYPVDRAMVDFFQPPRLPLEVEEVLRQADIIIYAPGSLYSSIIPILQVPGFAELIRQNGRALKILVSNIWVQKGETDAARDAPERKFHVSDLVRAYNRNIPGGVTSLFTHILTLGMGEIPGSVLQNYALEDKEPIYLDRQHLRRIGFEPVEAGIFSTDLLRRRHVIQHDPEALALAVRTLWSLQSLGMSSRSVPSERLPVVTPIIHGPREMFSHPCQRFKAIHDWLETVSFMYAENGSDKKHRLGENDHAKLRQRVADILWRHTDILIDHLRLVDGITLVESSHWLRCQQWDNIFSFYAPQERDIVIREDQTENLARFEMAFLIALGQSLLGNYAEQKTMDNVCEDGDRVGRIFRLTLRADLERECFLNRAELDTYLQLARMRPSEKTPGRYTRLVNSEEGFTPPGLLFGLLYTWYLDNRYASHIEYKMSIMRNAVSNLIPEQIKIVGRREGLVDFFRETVFRHTLSLGETK